MKQKLRTRSALGLMVIATAAVLAMLTAASSSHATVATRAVVPAVNGIGGHPMMSGPQQVASNATFGCQARPMDGSQGPRCYQAKQIQQAYNYSGLLASGIDGRGKTIVIIDAYGSPTIGTDLQFFDSVMGLPNPSFQVITPAGTPPPFDVNDPNQFGWSVETTLDVEWAHVMAPGANIILDVAKSNDDADILAATRYVIQNHIGDVISQSFGEAEACMDPSLRAQGHALFAQAAAQGQTVFASSGDSGASQPSCDANSNAALFAVSTPASDPNVTGVGGTTLTANTTTGAYISETAWTEPFGCNPPAVAPSDVNCSGGGFSTIYGRPSWQTDHSTKRGVPDVAYNAGVAGGVLIFSATINTAFGLPPNLPVFFIIGGTSAGSPQWSGLAADADQLAHHDLGLINDNLYGLGQDDQGGSQKPLHDITTGNNDVVEIDGGFDASRGWDPVTGLGTPNAALLLPAIANTQNQQ